MPPGFRKTAEMQRTLPGKSAVVQHLVYSDGLAAISIFIEPAGGEAVVPHGGSAQGAIHVFARAVAGHQVTVLGEVPAVTVRQVGEGIALRVK